MQQKESSLPYSWRNESHTAKFNAVMQAPHVIKDFALTLLGSEAKHKVLTDQIHGTSHIERLQETYRQTVLVLDLGSDMTFQQYILSAQEAINRHDLIETVTGMKRKHREAGAMISLATDFIISQNLDEYKINTGLEYDATTWQKKMWATAFQILHHHPEGMPTTDEVLERGYLIDVNKIRHLAQGYMEHPEYRFFAANFDALEKLPQPNYSREEIDVIRTQAYLVALADKIDQLVPAEASSSRTFRFNPKRTFYQNTFNGLLKNEFKARCFDGDNDESTDDLSRILFEMTRRPFRSALPGIESIYDSVLLNKALFLRDAIGQFLEGDFSRFVDFFNAEENRILMTILAHFDYLPQMSRPIINNNSVGTVYRIISQQGYKHALLDKQLEDNNLAREEVLQALSHKYNLMKEKRLLIPRHKKRIIQLLDLAVNKISGHGDTEYKPYREIAKTYNPIDFSSHKV